MEVTASRVMAFSSLVMILGECLVIHSMPALFCCCCVEVEISLHTLIPLLCQDQSTVAQQAEVTV